MRDLEYNHFNISPKKVAWKEKLIRQKETNEKMKTFKNVLIFSILISGT